MQLLKSIIRNVSTWYNRIYFFNIENRNNWVAAQAAQIPAGARVLDVGAGMGPYRQMFSHCSYFTQDFGKELATIGKYTTLDYESDITAIPVPDNSFDVILCTEVLEHAPEPIKAVFEMARILRPGGRLLLTAPLGSALHQEPYHFYGGFTPHWYRLFLAQAGFEVVSIEPNQGFFSGFGQESLRYSSYLHPCKTRQLRMNRRILLSLLWIVTYPLIVMMPIVGHFIDQLGIERISPVGYHVVSIKKQSV